MWDRAIIEVGMDGYKGRESSVRRLPAYECKKACQLRHQPNRERVRRIPREEAIARLKCDGHTLAKALDEYNYVKFTLNDDAVWQAEYQPCNSS